VSALIPALFVLAILVCAFIGLTETKVKEEVKKKLDGDTSGERGGRL
jgi:hypothetical protein